MWLDCVERKRSAKLPWSATAPCTFAAAPSFQASLRAFHMYILYVCVHICVCVYVRGPKFGTYSDGGFQDFLLLINILHIINMYVCMCADMYICMYMHVCMYLYIYAFIHMCRCMCMHICAQIVGLSISASACEVLIEFNKYFSSRVV